MFSIESPLPPKAPPRAAEAGAEQGEGLLLPGAGGRGRPHVPVRGEDHLREEPAQGAQPTLYAAAGPKISG